MVSWPVLMPGRTGGWFLVRPGNRWQWCGTIHDEQLWQERSAIPALGYHKVFLVGLAFVVLELAVLATQHSRSEKSGYVPRTSRSTTLLYWLHEPSTEKR